MDYKHFIELLSQFLRWKLSLPFIFQLIQYSKPRQDKVIGKQKNSIPIRKEKPTNKFNTIFLLNTINILLELKGICRVMQKLDPLILGFINHWYEGSVNVRKKTLIVQETYAQR